MKIKQTILLGVTIVASTVLMSIGMNLGFNAYIAYENRLIPYEESLGQKANHTIHYDLYEKDVEIEFRVSNAPVHLCFPSGCTVKKLEPGDHILRMNKPMAVSWTGKGVIMFYPAKRMPYQTHPLQIL